MKPTAHYFGENNDHGRFHQRTFKLSMRCWGTQARTHDDCITFARDGAGICVVSRVAPSFLLRAAPDNAKTPATNCDKPRFSLNSDIANPLNLACGKPQLTMQRTIFENMLHCNIPNVIHQKSRGSTYVLSAVSDMMFNLRLGNDRFSEVTSLTASTCHETAKGRLRPAMYRKCCRSSRSLWPMGGLRS